MWWAERDILTREKSGARKPGPGPDRPLLPSAGCTARVHAQPSAPRAWGSVTDQLAMQTALLPCALLPQAGRARPLGAARAVVQPFTSLRPVVGIRPLPAGERRGEAGTSATLPTSAPAPRQGIISFASRSAHAVLLRPPPQASAAAAPPPRPPPSRPPLPPRRCCSRSWQRRSWQWASWRRGWRAQSSCSTWSRC